MTVRDVFYAQAEHCDDLGSPFTAGLCRVLGDRLDAQTAVGRVVHQWPGEAGYKNDVVPLRLCGGLHSLVLSGKSSQLASAYPPVSSELPSYDCIEKALVEHEDYLLDWLTFPPQTNEVRRSAAIWPALCLLQEWLDLPLSVIEIGCSGGLNLQMDRFRYCLGGQELGAGGSSVSLRPEWTGNPAPTTNAVIRHRVGCDINPLDPLNPAENLRLRSYIWADQLDRMERHDQAVRLMKGNPVVVEKADAVSFLRSQLNCLHGGHLTVVYSTIAWQYLTSADQAEGERLIDHLGKEAGPKNPLAWLRFEGDGQPPGAAITLKVWPEVDSPSSTFVLGRADFHGRWVDWRGW